MSLTGTTKFSKNSPLEISKNAPRNIKQEASQLTPFGVGRLTLLLLYLYIDFMMGATIWGWDGLQGLLFQSGAYEWKCDPEAEELQYLELGDKKFISCSGRKTAVNNMFTIGFAATLLCSLLAGIMLDKFGPKICGTIGCLFQILGYTFIAISSEKLPLFYAGSFFIGAGTDAGYFPLLGVAQLYPYSRSFVLSIEGSVRSLSFSVPVILHYVALWSDIAPSNVMNVVLLYVIVFLGSCLILTLLFVPAKAIKPILVTLPSSTDNLTSAGDCTVSSTPANETSINKMEEGFSFNPSEATATSQVKQINIDVDRERKEIPQTYSGWTSQMCLPVHKDSTLFQCMMTWEYVAVCLVFFFSLLRSEFYTKSHKEQLYVEGVGNTYSAFSICNILSFIPGPFLGALVDKFDIFPAQAILTAVSFFQFALVMINTIPAKYASCFCLFIFNSFCVSNLYVYLTLHFPKADFGKLAGFASMVAGFGSFISIPIYNSAVNVFDTFIPADILMITICVITLILIYVEYYFNKVNTVRPGKQERMKPICA